MRRRGGNAGWIWLIACTGIAVVLLFGFEYLGSEQPQKITEIPVTMPDTKTGSQID
jgi:hypothetical protein